MTKLEIVQFYFSLLENFSTEENLFKTVWHPEFIQLELPNNINPQGVKSSFEDAVTRVKKSALTLNFQSFEILNSFETETHLIVEVYWTARFKTNHESKAFSCMVFEFKDELIIKQKNYDSFHSK